LGWLIFLLPFLLIILFPAVLYRWSLKSTALIWSPLLWIAGQISEVADLPRFLRDVVRLTFYKLSRLYSGIVILLFAGKIWLFFAFSQVAHSLDSFPGWIVLGHYVLPDEIPLWHMAAALNAVLAWVIFFQAERHMEDSQFSIPQPDALQNRFKALLVTRNVLSIYTALCTLYITWQITTAFSIPRLRVVPW
jgi:hypothetical protein